MAVRQLFGAYQPPAHVKLSSSSAPGRFSCSAPSPRTVSIPHGDAARQRRYLVKIYVVSSFTWAEMVVIPTNPPIEEASRLARRVEQCLPGNGGR